MNKRKPNIKFFRVFGCRCYLLNDYENVGKLKAKEHIGVFVGYSKESAAFIIYNKRTCKIHESMNVNFDEISEMASKQFRLQKVRRNDDGVFMFKFAFEEGLEQVLQRGPWMIHKSPIILTKWSSNLSLKKGEVTSVLVWVKLHGMPILAYSEDGLSMIATQIGKLLLLDAFTSSMCVVSWSRVSFVRALIEVSSESELKSKVTMAIPNKEGDGYTKEVIRAEYEWKPSHFDDCNFFGHDLLQCPKHVKETVINDPPKVGTSTTTVTSSDGFMEVTQKKNKGTKVDQQSRSRHMDGDEYGVSNSMGTTNKHTPSKWNEDFESDDEVDEVIFPKVFIHNHKDHLGKFDAKADNGYFLGYSFVSKSFRVFNTRGQQVEETYYVTFDEKVIAPNDPDIPHIEDTEGDCVTWDGGKTTWGGQVEAMGTAPVCVCAQESWGEGTGVLAGKLGSRDRPLMLAPGRYAQWRSRFLRYVDTRPNGKALRKCILSGPYKPTTILVQVIEATNHSPLVPEHTIVETPTNMSPENKAHFLAEKEAIHLILTGIRDDIYSTVDACQTAQEMFVTIVKQQHKLDEVSYHKLFDILKQYQNEVNELRAEKLARIANPLALVATAQASQDPYYQTPRSHRSSVPSPKPLIPTRSHTTTKPKGKEIAKPITPLSETASEEDNDPEQAQKDKDMQKNLALIAKYFKKIYKPTNNNLYRICNHTITQERE
nr:hypothetical protein [Tanacetum cinerariifolium]